MIQRENQHSRKRQAFTLMEMLVVVAIIVALAGMGGFFFINQLNASKMSTAKIQAHKWTEACETYYINNNTYPTSLQQLMQASGSNNEHQAIMKPDAPLNDPFGKPYTIVQPQGNNPIHVTSETLQQQPQAKK